MFREVVARLRRARLRPGREHHLLGFGRTDPPPALARLPRAPEILFGTEAWRPITQLADQRIRAHRSERLSVGELVETVSHEVEDAVATQPIEVSLDAWRTWAAATDTVWPFGFHELLVGANPSEADDVEAALHVHADLVSLMPQLVAARLSENSR